MLIPDFSASQPSDHLDLTLVDGQLFIDRQPVNDWMREQGVRLADLPRIWIQKSALTDGYRLTRAVPQQTMDQPAIPEQVKAPSSVNSRRVPDALRPFLSLQQTTVTTEELRGEEKGFFAERMDILTNLVNAMPKTHETDGHGDHAIVQLHYFHRGADWYITEKDSDQNGTGQVQAFGLADLGMGLPEMGYINIQEITRLGAEMDYHFAPRSLLDLKLEKYPEMVRGMPVAVPVAEFQPDQSPLRELSPFITATEVRHWTDVLNGKAATPPNTSIMEVRSRIEAIQEWLLRGGAAQMQAASDAGMNATAALYLQDMASGTDYALTATQQEPGKPAVAYGLSWNAAANDVSPTVSPIDLQSLMNNGTTSLILDVPMSLEAVMAHRLENMDPAMVEVHPLDDAFYQHAEAPDIIDARVLSDLFRNDAAFGVKYVESAQGDGGQSLFPDGTSAVICTNYALQVKRMLPNHDVQVVGFQNEHNPDCAVSRENWGDGHDFAIVDHRYLVDAWAKLVEGLREQIVYDMQDEQDARIVAETYGDPLKWDSVTEESLQWDRRGTEMVMAHASDVARTAESAQLKERATNSARSFGTTDPIAQEMLKRIEASPYTLAYLLGQWRMTDDNGWTGGTVEELYAWESAQHEFANEVDAILNARIQQNELALAEKGWGAESLHGDLTRKPFIGSAIHLEPDLDANDNMNGITYQIIQNGKLVESLRDYLDKPSTEMADALHAMASTANTDADERAAAALSGDPYPDEPETLDPALLAHLQERRLIRHAEHPNWSGLSDSVANAQEFVREHAMRNPELGEKWAAELRGHPFDYAEALGLESDNIRGIATLMEESVKRARHPALGDLVRFAPHDPDPLKGSVFSGRVIAALDTSGGDVRYYLRAETGPDQGMEAMVYGKNGSFRLIHLIHAYGFERNAPEQVAVENPEQRLPAQASAADIRKVLHQSISNGMSLGDLAGRLRAMGINAVMSSDDINQLFHMPVPEGTLLMGDVNDRHEDTAVVIKLPGTSGIVAWTADMNAYLQAEPLRTVDTDIDLGLQNDVFGSSPDTLMVNGAQVKDDAITEPSVSVVVSRGDYVRYRDEAGAEREGVVLDAAQPGEATRLRGIYRWPNGKPGMDGADHIALTVLPNNLMEHIPNAVRPGSTLDAVDPLTKTYQETMGIDSARTDAERSVLNAVEIACEQNETFLATGIKSRGDNTFESPEQLNATPSTISDPIVIDGKTIETMAFLEDRFGSDAQFGVRYTDEETGQEILAEDLPSFEGDMSSTFPDGGITNCTNYARNVQKALPAGAVRVVGFSNEANPNSDVVREGWHPGGHDFAIVDNRYLVDPWAKLLAGVRDRVVYDLQDDQDARIVAQTYGDQTIWAELPETGTAPTSEAKPFNAAVQPASITVTAPPAASAVAIPENPGMAAIPEAIVSGYPVQDFHIPEEGIQAFEQRVYVGDKRKARNNLAAIRLVQDLHNHYSITHHGLSEEEKNVLSAYVGWGGLPKAFRDTITGEVDPEWEDIVSEMEELLSSEDLAAARRSTLDAHYTSATIISAMWKGLETAGFKEGAVLEPSMGTGMFFALQPKALKESTQRFGVEMDATSARISQWLYPESRVDHDSFQHVNDLEGMMDVVIGNPPFGDQGVFDPVHPEWSDDAPSIHNYFFRKGLGQLQPGGVLSFVVSRYFLDAVEPQFTAFRERLHRDAELVTAVRLPKNAFMASAGTQVVTDIVFFRKREEPLIIDADTEYPDWVSGDGIIGQDPDTGRGVPGNRYYESHPDHIMGIPVLARGMYREDESVVLPVKGANKEEENQQLGMRIQAVINADMTARNMTWPESRLLAEQRWMSDNALYAVSGTIKDNVSNGSFFLVEADTATAIADHEFHLKPNEDMDAVQARLNKAFPPRLAVRVHGYRGYAFANEMLVQVPTKAARKGGKDVSNTADEDADAEGFSYAQGDVLEAPGAAEATETPEMSTKRAFSDTEIQRITGMVSIRDALQRLLRAQVNERMADADVEGYRDALNDAYDAFTGKYGLLNRPVNRRAFAQDTFSGALLSLEKDYLPEISAAVSRRTGEEVRPESASKAPLFFTRTQRPYILQDKAETPLDALRLSLSQQGRVDPIFIQTALRDTEWAGDWSGKIWEDLKPHLVLDLGALERGKFWESAPISWPYQEKTIALSGDVLDKLERVDALLSSMQAQDILTGIDEVARLKNNLEKVQPDRVQMKDIGVRFGASWVDVQTYKDFAVEIMGAEGEPEFQYEKALASWTVGVSIPHDQQLRWGVGDARSPRWLLEKTINRQPLLVTERLSDGSTWVMEKETEIAKQKSQELQKAWKQWVFSNESAAQRLEALYNQKFNRFRAPQFDGRHLDLIGASSSITMRPHQKNAVWRGMQSGNVFFDHAVGAGKTFAASALIMEMRRLGRAQKPLLVVPNHLVDQWRGAFLELYPSANVLTASAADADSKRCQIFLGKAAYGQWDAVIIPHSLFQRIPPDPYWSGKVMEEEVSSFKDAIRALSENNPDDKRTIKKMERKVERIQSVIKKANHNTGKKDAGLTMGDLGVDMLVVDEVQEFKNLPYITEMQNVAGLGNPEGSAKAQDLYIKARSIQKMREDHGGLVYLSGTPLSNTMAELYTWMRHFAYEKLDDMGILHFDAWQNAFADVSRDYAFTLTGQYKEKAYLSVFDNLPELRALTQQFMDTVSIADVQQMLADEGMPDMPIPPIEGGKPKVIVCQPTESQKAYIGFEVGEDESGTPVFNEGSILDRLDHLPKRPEKGEDNILSLSGEMSKVGLDIRAVTGKANGDDHSENGEKLIRCADEIMALYTKWNEDKGTQLVFLDFSTPISTRKGGRTKPSVSEQAILDALESVRKYEQDLEDYGEADESIQKKSEHGQELLETMSPQEIEDVESKYLGGEDRWSAYEALREMLIQRGIPEDEVAFIHEYEKPQEKAELFGMMRSGKKRVLLGSSAKMGSGMNVQDRIVGLHHLDAPYRPLDIEQRNGRGLRQGNRLLEKYGPEKFQLAVNYYVTEGAGDAGRWQILEFKKKFIDQYAQRNSGIRRVEDPSAQALDPARIKAESSGSDILMDKTVMNDLSKRLEVAEGAWNNSLRELRHHIKNETLQLDYLKNRLPIVETAAQAAHGWLMATDQRQSELDAERKALVEARKEEREQARIERQKKKAEKSGEQQKDATGDVIVLDAQAETLDPADQADELVLAGDHEEADNTEAEGEHSDVRGPMRYTVSTSLDDVGQVVMADRVDQRMSDWGRDTLQFTAQILRNILRDARASRKPYALMDETKRHAGGPLPLAQIEHDGEILQMVMDGVNWKGIMGSRKLPDNDDSVNVDVYWLASDGKKVSEFTLSLQVGALYALDKPAGLAALRLAFMGVGRKIINGIQNSRNRPAEFKESIQSGTAHLASYQSEYDRLTFKNGERNEDFPQANRLTLVNAVNYCMDTALKGGLRKSSVIDEKIETLQENHRKARDEHAERIKNIAATSSDQKSSDTKLEGAQDNAHNAPDAQKVTAVMQKIEANLERLQAVVPELRYWSVHREELVEKLKDDQVDDAAFAEVIAVLQDRSGTNSDALETLPFDREQLSGLSQNQEPAILSND